MRSWFSPWLHLSNVATMFCNKRACLHWSSQAWGLILARVILSLSLSASLGSLESESDGDKIVRVRIRPLSCQIQSYKVTKCLLTLVFLVKEILKVLVEFVMSWRCGEHLQKYASEENNPLSWAVVKTSKNYFNTSVLKEMFCFKRSGIYCSWLFS